MGCLLNKFMEDMATNCGSHFFETIRTASV